MLIPPVVLAFIGATGMFAGYWYRSAPLLVFATFIEVVAVLWGAGYFVRAFWGSQPENTALKTFPDNVPAHAERDPEIDPEIEEAVRLVCALPSPARRFVCWWIKRLAEGTEEK